jgi:hypothetical protein
MFILNNFSACRIRFSYFLHHRYLRPGSLKPLQAHYSKKRRLMPELYDDLKPFTFNFRSNFFRESFIGKYGKREFQKRDLKCAQFIKFTAVNQHIDALAAPKQFRNFS